MRRFFVSVHVCLGALYSVGCGGGSGDGPAEVEAFPDPIANVPVEPEGEDSVPSPSELPDQGEGNVSPRGLDDGSDEPVPAPAGDGLLINGTCVAVCASAATDADANGVTDGWGWEDEASCLVAGSAPAAQGAPCAIQPVIGPPIVPPGGTSARPEGVDSNGFFVADGRLFDRLGNDFVMRGVNNPLAWFRNRDTGALAWLDEIAATGANAVRLVWETDVPDTNLLREAIQRSVELAMVPMVELHDVTGGRDIDDPARMARYYTENEAVRAILIDYEPFLLVNIANEWDGANDIYVEAYTRAIDTLRDAGINHTLVIDANGYGQSANTVITQGQTLLGVDPQHNLMFSTHMYQNFRNAETIVDTLERAAEAQIPFMVGEFGFQHGEDNQGNPIPIPFEVLLAEAERHGFGYLAWSWTGNGSPVEYLDLTARSGSVDQLSGWGDDIINGPNGIRATSQISSIFLE